MISIKTSNTNESAIIAMGVKLANAMKETGKEYLLLNRGVNSVENINISEVVKNIDFNSNGIQVYPGSKGKVKLRNAINKEYFNAKADTKNILVTAGGISGLDITFQNIETKKVWLPNFFWGTYAQILKLRGINYDSYKSYSYLKKHAQEFENQTIVICDPGNPLGEKHNDNDLVELIKTLDKHNVSVVIDCPYRRLFTDQTDDFFLQIMNLQNIIIVESFSKSLGLSGQRIGFVHSANKNFINEANLRILYSTNGINGFAQSLVSLLLDSDEGKKAVSRFKSITYQHIVKNIEFLKNNKLLANEFYENSKPQGIFAVINKNTDELFQQRIGSVSMNYFTLNKSEHYNNFSRILVSCNHDKFTTFFKPFI